MHEIDQCENVDNAVRFVKSHESCRNDEVLWFAIIFSSLYLVEDLDCSGGINLFIPSDYSKLIDLKLKQSLVFSFDSKILLNLVWLDSGADSAHPSLQKPWSHCPMRCVFVTCSRNSFGPIFVAVLLIREFSAPGGPHLQKMRFMDCSR